MKNIIFFLSLAFLLSSCVKESQEYKDLLAQNDSLQAVVSGKDKDLQNYLKTLNEIADNFQAISEAEKLINKDANGDHINGNAEQRINQNLQLMAKKLEENRNKLAQLQGLSNKLKSTNKKQELANLELQKTIERLTGEMDQKAGAIDSLTNVIKQKDERIIQLDGEVGRLNDDVAQKASIISQQEDELSSAWYVFGTKKELKNQKILTKDGMFKKSEFMRKDFNRDYFVKIDIRNTTKIPLYSKKATVLTTHPNKSYKIDEENGNKVLVIKNAKDFWSISKYLVVRTD
ncbi:MAG: hypothetical protein II766_00325 [Paludibacteraceae bacterium]|jgi:hypothetical protein|nr:hypothetical protein [Paludibacteraceae bacterium]